MIAAKAIEGWANMQVMVSPLGQSMARHGRRGDYLLRANAKVFVPDKERNEWRLEVAVPDVLTR